MNKEEIEDILEELHLVRPEILKPKAKKLFEAIMSIADERDELQQENQELKKQYCERTDCSGRLGNSKKVDQLEKELEQLKEIEKEHKKLNGELRVENKELKKQLEENQNPLKGIFAQVNDDTLLRDCGNMNAEINELKNQQKEFIKYMNDISEDLETEDVDDEEMKGYLIQRIDTFKEILQKYRSIIGDKE